MACLPAYAPASATTTRNTQGDTQGARVARNRSHQCAMARTHWTNNTPPPTSADFGIGILRLCSVRKLAAARVSVRPIRGWPIATFVLTDSGATAICVLRDTRDSHSWESAGLVRSPSALCAASIVEGSARATVFFSRSHLSLARISKRECSSSVRRGRSCAHQML
jgi:hypothetical protein